MNSESFDAKVRATFEGETMSPPSHIEEAVFSQLSARQRRKTQTRWLLAAALLAPTVWFGWNFTDDSQENNARQEVPNSSVSGPIKAEEVLAPDGTAITSSPLETNAKISDAELQISETNVSFDSSLPVIDSAVEVDVNSKPSISNAGSSMTAVQGIDSIMRRDANLLELKDSQGPAILQKHEETWVMPGVVKIKE